MRIIALLVTMLVLPIAAEAQYSVTLNAYDTAVVTLRAKDLRGNPSKFTDGVVVWSAPRDGVVAFRNCNNETCTLVWLGGPDSIAVSVKGPGVNKTVTIDVTTKGAAPVDFDLEISPPIPDSALLRVSGIVEVALTSSDDTGVTSAELRVDGVRHGEPVENPPAEVTIAWDTATVSEGTHVLQGFATDAAGNVGVSRQVAVKVEN